MQDDRPPRRWGQRLLVSLIVVFSLLVAGEFLARFHLGLGDPPLWVEHPTIEYLAVPSRTYHRYGNRISYNAFSMRSDEFPVRREDTDEFRVICFGDSVINGGSKVDQTLLATERIKRRLGETLQCPVMVGNVSAGSWGPANQLAYAEAYGLFEADVVVLVVSSNDYKDHPTFAPAVGIRPGLPAGPPFLAMQELFTRFGPTYARRARREGRREAKPVDPVAVEQSLAAAASLIALAQRLPARVVVLQHASLWEVRTGKMQPGHAVLLQTFRDMGIDPIQSVEKLRASLRHGRSPYLDHIHPNETGHEILGDLLIAGILDAGRPETSD